VKEVEELELALALELELELELELSFYNKYICNQRPRSSGPDWHGKA
jgi:hypothetical protein